MNKDRKGNKIRMLYVIYSVQSIPGQNCKKFDGKRGVTTGGKRTDSIQYVDGTWC